jgi:hypothetical protein
MFIISLRRLQWLASFFCDNILVDLPLPQSQYQPPPPSASVSQALRLSSTPAKNVSATAHGASKNSRAFLTRPGALRANDSSWTPAADGLKLSVVLVTPELPPEIWDRFLPCRECRELSVARNELAYTWNEWDGRMLIISEAQRTFSDNEIKRERVKWVRSDYKYNNFYDCHRAT